MARGTARHRCYILSQYFLKVSAVSSSLLGLLFTAGKSTDSYDWFKPLGVIVSFVNSYGLIIFIALVLLSLAGYILASVGRDRWVEQCLLELLNEYRNSVFEDYANEPIDNHRVTVFKHRRLFCPWRWTASFGKHPLYGYWLVPQYRSGHTMQDSKIKFKAPPKRPAEAEGVAGQAWRGETVEVQDLVPISKLSNSHNKRRYSENSNITEAMVEKILANGGQLPQSMVGIPLKVGQEVWGSLVIDSVNPRGACLKHFASYTLFIKTLGRLLEKLS